MAAPSSIAVDYSSFCVGQPGRQGYAPRSRGAGVGILRRWRA